MTALDERLRALGDVLELPDDANAGFAAAVLARLDEPAPATDRRLVHLARVAAILVLLAAIAVAAVPSSRRAVADWFGLDGVEIERRPGVPPASAPDPVDRGDIGRIVEVDGVEILLSEFAGTLDQPLIGKIATDDTTVRPVEVAGSPGFWIDGAPHEVAFFDPDGTVVFERVAGNTLLWQDGRVIRRLEGFSDVDRAIDYAERIWVLTPLAGGT